VAHDSSCVACGGGGVRPKWRERRKYRYFVVVTHQLWTTHDDELEPLPKDLYVPAGLKYRVARCPVSDYGESLSRGTSGSSECLASCGRFTEDWHEARTFASDREADRTVERLASGLPVFITRWVAIGAAFAIAAPAWISAIVMWVQAARG